jgi:hypothetical protein
MMGKLAKKTKAVGKAIETLKRVEPLTSTGIENEYSNSLK